MSSNINPSNVSKKKKNTDVASFLEPLTLEMGSGVFFDPREMKRVIIF